MQSIINHRTNSLPDLIEGLSLDILVNDNGKVMVGYDRALQENLKPVWFEYDNQRNTLVGYTEDGQSYDLGLKIFTLMGKHLQKAKEIAFIYIQDKKVVEIESLPMVLRESGAA